MEASLAIQWLTLQAPTAGGAGLTPGQGTEISHAAQNGRKKKKGIEKVAPTKSSSFFSKDAASGLPAEDERGKKQACKDLSSWAQVAVVPSATPEEQAALRLRGSGGTSQQALL